MRFDPRNGRRCLRFDSRFGIVVAGTRILSSDGFSPGGVVHGSASERKIQLGTNLLHYSSAFGIIYALMILCLGVPGSFNETIEPVQVRMQVQTYG